MGVDDTVITLESEEMESFGHAGKNASVTEVLFKILTKKIVDFF